ncbi:hypothetical protein [Nocardia harenae]|uniref:hypothetical protein n=1 Tax=Nocardia harenae TaxID=358707 RepID=UPI0012ED22EB|nr:hypothetical protein [Nocardia harenae]
MRDRVRTRPWSAERARLAAERGPDGWATRWADTGARIDSEIRAILLDAVLGQHEPPAARLPARVRRLHATTAPAARRSAEGHRGDGRSTRAEGTSTGCPGSR